MNKTISVTFAHDLLIFWDTRDNPRVLEGFLSSVLSFFYMCCVPLFVFCKWFSFIISLFSACEFECSFCKFLFYCQYGQHFEFTGFTDIHVFSLNLNRNTSHCALQWVILHFIYPFGFNSISLIVLFFDFNCVICFVNT